MSEELNELIEKFENAFEPEFIYGGLAAIKPNYKAQQEARRAIVAYVANLESELARLREERRWIPVSERLPEVEGDYLVVIENPPLDREIDLDHYNKT